ncbi:MAG: hypothetical protein IAE77_13995 [Prosthecobacter sp.]|jgi:hypothetical protein|uniref:hypothetical protein n=1 Tax=Prosthecobacter sp. TaxID=1965333 RepID=UPI0019F54E4F|nr:hypothetical protein [Prosthecobacter sp.]MBE2284564.1 hypothetical protein [Prosthecobacter sp.]
MKHLLLFGFSLLLATHAALAGQVMVKSLPAVTNGNATHYAGTVDTALPFGFPPSSASTSPPSPANPGTVPGSAPGFRSVSNPTHTFITGWCDMPPAGALRPRDGFISKVDPTGAVIWTRSMNGLIGSTAGSVGFLINDVAILAPFLYACGQTTDGKAFVAKLDYDGVVQDYTLIRDNGGSATARATGICVTIVSGSSQVAVSGDFGANNLIVDQRRMTGGTSTFGTMNGRYSHGSNRDVFMLRMDTSLNATWATTLGFSPANDYATAIAADGSGNLFVAMNFQNPDGALASLSYSNIDDERNVMVPGSSTTMADTSTYNYDFNVGNWGTLVMINAQNGVGARIVHHSEPVKVDNSNNVNITNASSRIVDMEFSNGVINAVGEFSRNFRASSSANVNPSSGELFGSVSNTYDVFVAQLDPTNLTWTRYVFLASGNDDFAGQITAGSDGLYVTGSAGAALSHRVPGSTITTLSGATARHLFWMKLNSTNLSHMWHVTPVELISSGYSVPSVMNSAGVGVVGNVAVISGYYNGGAMTMGTTGSYTTLPAPGVPLGFTGFLKTDGTWFEQVNVTIQSDYGLPSPYGGTQVLATGTAVRATVPQIVYEDAAGNVLDDSDPEIIRRDAVTRRVCTGYQFKSSSVNGTANVVDFVVNDDLVLNFLWRTEHALEILTNLPAGLTSQAAGTPSPAVNKHWLAENTPVIAQIDGAAYTDQDGMRYRSSGYTATGLAVPQGWLDGAFVPWSSFQLRQQVPQFTLAGPATITWQWQKEFRLRVSANASLASSAPYVDGVPVSTTTIVPQSTTAYTATSVDGFPGPAGSSGFGNGWPFDEGPSMLNDGLATTKYLNFNKTAAGAILYYTAPITANRIRLTSANDAPERDPALIRIEGRNYVSGVAQPFQMIHTGLAIPAGPGRGVMQELAFDNTSSYKDYRVTFLAVQNDTTATAVQVAELTFVNETAAGAVTSTSAGPRLTGSGDFWAPPGTVLTAASAPSVSGGIGSLALKGYTGGTGSVVPFDTRGVTTKAITLNSPSTIIWDYARAIYPETVTIGNFVTFSTVTGIDATNVNKLKTPDGGVTVDVPANSTWMDMQTWDQVGQKLYPLRPGKFTVEFENLAAPEDTTQNVIVEVTAVWPGATDYNHIIEAPAVDMDPSDTDNRAFQKITYTEAAATVSNAGLFSNTEEGRSVLLFSQRPAGVAATGNLTLESLSVKTVRSQFWKNAVGPKPNVPIGTAITMPDHDINAVGHNGYVLTRLAPVNFGVYDLATMQGPIIPVNIQYPPVGAWNAPDNPAMLTVAWYQVVDGLKWPYKATAYNPQWPSTPPRIVVASQLGSEGLKDTLGTQQTLFTAPQYNAVSIYNQPDATKPGYNPNEEHALVAPSFLNASRTAAFALRNDLNRTAADVNYTSSPYVLVNYRDDSDPANPVPKMAVYAIQLEDASTSDTRLPTFNQSYIFRYQGVAGTKLQPPYPLNIVIGINPMSQTNGLNFDPSRVTYYEDKTGQPWIVSGDTDAADDITAEIYYALRGDFWHPTSASGFPIRFGPALPQYNIRYNAVWPDNTGFLKAGETLTFSGGEYASDHAGDTPAPLPLPGAIAWQSAKVTYDDANPSLDTSSLASNYLVRVVPALAAREVPLAVGLLPDSLKPASGNVIVEGGLWRFKKLNAGLQKRIYYNSITGMLGVRGFLNGRTLGDPDLTAAPGAQTILQPSVLTAVEEFILSGIDVDPDWTAAVAALAALSRDPQNLAGVDYGVGLQAATPSGVQPATSIGPGTAVITNPDLLNPGYQPSLTTGYVTIAENDDPSLGDAPVVIHVFRVTRSEVYRGSLASIYPENVFDEKITVRHTGDFGADVGDLFFEWQYREEDGRALNPPGITLPTAGTPSGGDWTLFNAGTGLNEIQLAGASAALLTDNLFFCRYRHKDADGNVAANWSQWAGAANSRPPNASAPSATTDAAYVAQLVAGWVKRVTDAVNVFDARISDFRNNDAPATYTSMIQQAGQRYEGPVAFNPTKDVIENYGMIELYQTVLERAKDLSIDLAPGTSGINTALLNAANRISQFYTLIGNEAYSDAIDPTIGFSTQSNQYGALAPTIHAFQNQTADLLDEELALLRGRGEIGARPAYNRLLWNFTNGQGEAAYALNYAISDVDNDGFIDADDAQRLYPQGHGDAWGHYTMALKGYADLFTNNRFSWDPRSELYQINGVVFNIDYLDERAFAETAAARAKAGVEIVDLVYRQKYTENPAGQWQGYQDTNTDRAWGVYEWGQRAATAAYFDWAVGNALLPSSDTTHEGIQKVDRSTVGGLGVLAGNAALIQSKVESADRGYNPLGLDPNVVPFDIDPVRVDRTSVNPATHFEQVYERAVAAASNAITTWDHANQLNNLLRRTGASTEELRQQTKHQDLDYRNRLIEIFGSPYAGTIGAGQAYPEGYTGPDLYLYMYVDTTQVNDATVPQTPADVMVQYKGLLNLSTNTNPFGDTGVGSDQTSYATSLLNSWFPSNYFPSDNPKNLGFTSIEGSSLNLTLPVTASGYAFNAPSSWGMRSSPGTLQLAIAELIQAEAAVVQASADYDGLAGDLDRKLRNFTAKTGIATQDIAATNSSVQNSIDAADHAANLYDWATGIRHAREFAYDLTVGYKEGIPQDATDWGSFLKSAIQITYAVGSAVTRIGEALFDTSNYRAELHIGDPLLQLQIDQTKWGYQADVIDMLDDLEDTLNSEPDLRFAAFRAIERLRKASDQYRTLLQEGLRLVDEREAFNKRIASTTTKQRYEDMTFRVTRNDALRKYRSAYDLAARYAYLAGKAYAYELNLPDSHAANATPLLADIIRTRDLGVWQNGQPVLAHGGLASHLATLKGNFDHFKGQMGFNNPATQTYTFSLRADLGRVAMSTREDATWRQKLETWRVPDLWNYTHSDGTTNYGFIYRRFCRPFAAEFDGSGNPVPQPALVIPFTSTIQSGKNWFDNNLAAGDSALNASEFATKIRAVGVRFDSYNTAGMSVTPQVYLIPLGADRMFLADSNTLQTREWNVVDQRIPTPLPITPAQLTNPDWHPFTGSTSGYFDEIRKFSSFRAFPDSVGTTRDDIISSSRLVGRSAWNTKWVLIIPNASLLYDAASTTAGLDTFVHGLPKSGESQSSAGTDPAKRDLLGVRDIKLMIETYSVSGN